MAKKAAPTGSGSRAKPKARTGGARKTQAGGKGRASSAGSRQDDKKARAGEGTNAADAVIGLLESPLVADLLSAAVTAAAATMLEHRLKSRRGRETGSMVRAVGAAAAAAVGKQLAAELDDIRRAAEEAREDGEIRKGAKRG